VAIIIHKKTSGNRQIRRTQHPALHSVVYKLLSPSPMNNNEALVHTEDDNEADVPFSDWATSTATVREDVSCVGNTSWNVDAFEQRIENSTDWTMNFSTQSSETKHITRFQDLCLGLDSRDGIPVEPTKKEWPFESSPCRLFGGKNTRPNSASAAATNAELFFTNFDAAAQCQSEETTPELVVETRASEKNLHRTISGSSKRRSVDASSSFSEKRTDRRSSVNRNLYNNSSERVTATDKRGAAVKVSDDDDRCLQMHRLSMSRSTSREILARPEYNTGSDQTGEGTIGDADEKSRHKRRSSRSRSKSSERLGPKSSSSRPCELRMRSKSPGRRVTPGRHQSSDNLEFGVSSGLRKMRNSGSQQEIRLTSDSETKEIAASIRRPKISRAMSTDNVKPPEDYRPSGVAQAKSVYGGGEQKRRGRRITAAERVNPGRSLSRARRDAEEQVKGKETRDNATCVSNGLRSSDDSDDDCMDEGAVHTRFRDSLRKMQETGGQKSFSVLDNGHDEPVRRDLRDLLRDKVAATMDDFGSKENRRLLHFLIYEHKLGVSIKELKATIAEELADNPEKILCRPPLPLYVEPA
jgi:hypothetical protein